MAGMSQSISRIYHLPFLCNNAALIRNKISMIDDLQQKLELSRLELASAQLETQEKATLQQQEVGKMQLYTQIASSKLSTAQARVESLRRVRCEKDGFEERQQKLRKDRICTMIGAE
ncbi:hypothetical protein [Leptodesmis sichuanensis]|uniref:hypothetical protein n=1 Tax=Leptodesmis sichuanensis TaxID=2906798 RepID=UPI001F224331|nr:hypothetical protein [Leptodesmis sichuanensis]UIE38567.1 hypothetical protein KIK02_02685 [Leptodesmis sichuanensis A121]